MESSLQLHCINSITLLNPPLPLSLLSQSIHPPVFFPPMPQPYLSILSSSSFRRHFSSSSPVAHPGVTRFSVARGRRQKRGTQSGGHRRAPDAHEPFGLQHAPAFFRGIPVRHRGEPAQTSDRCRERFSIPRVEIIPEGITCFSPTHNTRRSATACQWPCGFNLMTPYMCHQLKLCVTLHASSRLSERLHVM